MAMHSIEEGAPKFYGATTVGERGQVVIPAEARREFDIAPADKLLVFGGPHGHFLILARAEAMTELIARASSIMASVAETLESAGK